MKTKGLMKFGYLIAAIFLVSFILITLEPVSPGLSSCKILPDTPADRQNYCPDCGVALAECAIKNPTTGNGVGSYGCACAEIVCTDWCQNDICDWEQGVKICRAVCNINTKMEHCVGLVPCPTAGAPCDGELCGLVPAGGCCQDESDCITGTGKCTVPSSLCMQCEQSHPNQPCVTHEDCYGYEDGTNICCGGKCMWTKGDVDNSQNVNILDIVILAIAFGTQPGDPNWNTDVDLDNNGIINIMDILIVAVSFGCSW